MVSLFSRRATCWSRLLKQGGTVESSGSVDSPCDQVDQLLVLLCQSSQSVLRLWDCACLTFLLNKFDVYYSSMENDKYLENWMRIKHTCSAFFSNFSSSLSVPRQSLLSLVVFSFCFSKAIECLSSTDLISVERASGNVKSRFVDTE